MSIVVRQLERADEADWLKLWTAYLEFYKTPMDEAANAAVFDRLVTGAPHFAFVAEKGGAVIGFVHALPHASTWDLDGYCYLEDLFVDMSARGTGAGRALIEAVYAEADRRGLKRVYWITDEGNARARALYDTLATKSDFVQYRR
ncbi:MAG: GNAT family N-acetyltransferase [Pseudomonadota bacterium]